MSKGTAKGITKGIAKGMSRKINTREEGENEVSHIAMTKMQKSLQNVKEMYVHIMLVEIDAVELKKMR